jgi:ketosteroid isomerase-like protein
MSTLRTRNVALTFLGHLERGEVAAAMMLVADDVAVWAPGHPGMTKPQLHEFLSLALERFIVGSLTLKPIGTTAEGDRVAIEAESSVRLKTGGEYTNRYHFLFIVRDGRIRAFNIYSSSGLAVDASWTGATG